MDKETSGFSAINDNGVKHTTPNGIDDVENSVVDVPTSIEPYGPATKRGLRTPDDGTHLVRLRLQVFFIVAEIFLSGASGLPMAAPETTTSRSEELSPAVLTVERCPSRRDRWATWRKVVKKILRWILVLAKNKIQDSVIKFIMRQIEKEKRHDVVTKDEAS